VADHNYKVDHSYAPKSSVGMVLLPTTSGPDIKFYHSHEPYYEFTNFATQYPIQLDGRSWPTTEHYFQAQKFIGTPYEEAIRRQPNARGAFDMSRNPSVSHWRRGDWDQVKNDIMLKCLKAKFTQHKSLKKLLLGTGDKRLIEHTSNDSYWGDGRDGSGQNKLGKLLMQVRKELSKVNDTTPATPTMPYWSSFVYDYPKSDYKEKEKQKSQSTSSSHRHRRRNSFSGSISTTVHSLSPEPEDVKPLKYQRSGSLSNLTTAVNASTHYQTKSGTLQRKIRSQSTENLCRLSQSSKKDTSTPRHAFRMTNTLSNMLSPSDRYTKSQSYSNVFFQPSENKAHFSDFHRRTKASSSCSINRVPNQSSVGYNIVTHEYRKPYTLV